MPQFMAMIIMKGKGQTSKRFLQEEFLNFSINLDEWLLILISYYRLQQQQRYPDMGEARKALFPKAFRASSTLSTR